MNTELFQSTGNDIRRFNWSCVYMRTLLVLAAMLLWPVSAGAESRLALVIGNGGYQESPLSNPLNDALDMASVLESLGFDVILETDADRRQMGRAIREFGKRLKRDRGVGLFYYAGHGMQVDNRNYLIPIDAPLAEEDEVPYESVDVGSVLAKMQSAGNALNILILDACRNNPFPSRFRSANRGLARVEAPIGSLVVYATAPGRVAADGNGRNGTFTGHLLTHLKQPGLSLTQTIRRTRAAVVAETNGTQVPWESSSLLTEYYLNPAREDSTDAALSSAQSSDIRFWNSVRERDAADEYRAYLERYPEGAFVELAQLRLERLAAETKLNDDADATSESVLLSKAGTEEQIVVASTKALSSDALGTNDNDEVFAEPEQEPLSVSLTVRSIPADARIRIMNIVEKYRDGIDLRLDKSYDIYVTKPGYLSYRQRHRLEPGDNTIEVELSRRVAKLPGSIALPAGQFRMGCSSGDRRCEAYEKPTRDIDINAFSMTPSEITVAQFRSFVEKTGYKTDAEKNSANNQGCYVWSEAGGISRSNAGWSWKAGYSWRNPGYRQQEDFPVTCVSWNDATAYAKWLSSETGKTWRLPTESEWEYAARAGSTARYYGGSDSELICAYANGADGTRSPDGSRWSDRTPCNDGHWFSAPVASRKPNAFGLYDMQGNVWEWVEDIWSSRLNNTPDNGTAYRKGNSDDRVLRGGAWDGGAGAMRLSHRSKGERKRRAAMIGFRLVHD